MSTRSPLPALAARIQALRNHLTGDPEDRGAWLDLARALSNLPATNELYHAIEQAIRSLPDREAPWLLAAAIHERERGLEAALAWLEHCARQNPALVVPRQVIGLLRSSGSPEGAWARGNALREEGKWARALREYRRIEGLHADDPALMINIGSCLASLEDHAAAADYFAGALRGDPASVQARLNLGLLHALQSRQDEAVRCFDELLAATQLDSGTRHAARTMRQILLEQRRLQPFLETAIITGELGAYRDALAQRPADLSQPHAETEERLHSLARACSAIEIDPAQFRYASDTSALPFVEACTQCKLDSGGADMARLCESLNAAPGDATLPALQRRILHFRRLIEARSKLSADRLSEAEGEALLTCLHARLLRDQPELMPGHYKLAANAIAGMPLTPPEFVAGTFRTLLAGIRPTLPRGFGRALFMFVAVNMIHGFVDGNGRLSRFILSWEAEGCGMNAIPVPMNFRATISRNTNLAWLTGELQPLVAALSEARAHTGRLLAQFQAAAAEGPGAI